MDEREKFSSITDLYKRLLPALKTKKDDLHKMKLYDIKEVDIWSYCVDNLWKNKKDLRIYNLVDDIMHADEIKICAYKKRNDSK